MILKTMILLSSIAVSMSCFPSSQKKGKMFDGLEKWKMQSEATRSIIFEIDEEGHDIVRMRDSRYPSDDFVLHNPECICGNRQANGDGLAPVKR